MCGNNKYRKKKKSKSRYGDIIENKMQFKSSYYSWRISEQRISNTFLFYSKMVRNIIENIYIVYFFLNGF